jgi:hypothetical protein
MMIAAVLLIFPLVVPAVFGQPNPRDPWSDLRSNNPPGIRFSLRLVKAQEFRQGELITMEMSFPGQSLVQSPPSKELWQGAGFLLDPPVDCGSMGKLCLFAGRVLAGPPDPVLNLGRRTEPAVLHLNTYVPALKPGRYRAALLAYKLVLADPDSRVYRNVEPAEFAISDTIEFDVVPPSPSWIRETIADAVAILKGPLGGSGEGRTAAQQLSYLGGTDAWRAAAEVLTREEDILLRAFSARDDPASLCDLLKSRIPHPEQSVSSDYLRRTVQVCEQAHLPRTPSGPMAATGLTPEQQAYLENQRTYEEELRKSATDALVASLPQKQAPPLIAAFTLLLEYVQQLRNSEPSRPAPEWIPVLTREFVRSYPRMGVSPRYPLKEQLLGFFASTIPSPALVPLIESTLNAWKPGDRYEAPRIALRALYDVDPSAAQTRIIEQLKDTRTWLDTSILDLLPPTAVPAMDDELLDALEGSYRMGGWNPELHMAAVAKYATPAAGPRVRAIYESHPEQCQPEILAYFIRVDSDYADRIFQSHAWDMPADPARCAVQYLRRTMPLAVDPALEQMAAPYLMHGTVPLKTEAARALGLYGSNRSLEALWGAFRYFHEYWRGKRGELARNIEGSRLELVLRDAIARGRNWQMNEDDLRTLESLCVSQQCIEKTQQGRGAAEQR